MFYIIHFIYYTWPEMTIQPIYEEHHYIFDQLRFNDIYRDSFDHNIGVPMNPPDGDTSWDLVCMSVVS